MISNWDFLDKSVKKERRTRMEKKSYPAQQICKNNSDTNTFLEDAVKVETTKNRLLLHSCCGPCSTACIERVLPDYKVSIFFYNPCITDKVEYEKRKEAQIKFLNAYNEVAAEYADEPEGGKRCTECFKLRLERTAEAALRMGYNIFGTTLTVSPHKNYNLISAIGASLGSKYNLEFLDIDFKKKAGFQRSIQMSKEYELYRQNYCGCEFSKYFLEEKK